MAIKNKKKIIINVLVSGIIVSVIYIPWLVVLFHQFRRWTGAESGWGNTLDPVTIKSFLLYFPDWFSSSAMPNWGVVIFLVLLILIITFFSIRYILHEKDFFPCMAILISLIVFLFAMAVSIFIVPCFLGRYLFPMFGGIFLFIAVGLYEVKNKFFRFCAILGIVFCGMITYYNELKLENSNGLDVYLQAIDKFDESTVIMADTYFTLMFSVYEPERRYMIYGGMAECIPFGNVERFTEWDQLENDDIVLYITFDNFRAGNLLENYVVTEEIPFHYSYYDIVLQRYEKIFSQNH